MNQLEPTNVPIQAADPGPVASDTTSEESSDWRFRGVAPMIRKAMEKHYREWEGLMKRHANRWAIYHGDERLEIGKSREKLYRKYRDRGFKREELLVLGICPPIEDDPEEPEPGQPDEGPSVVAHIEVHPMIRKAMEKHRREWEELMERHEHQWAIYHGDERLEIGKSREKLYRKYRDRGFKREELLVLGIWPPIEDEIDDEELYDF